MMAIYDMNTSQIIESGQGKNACTDPFFPERELHANPQLQFIVSSCQARKERVIPPELANAELDAFLQKMR